MILVYLGIIHELFKSLFYRLFKSQKYQDFSLRKSWVNTATDFLSYIISTKDFMSTVIHGINIKMNLRF